MTENKLLKVFIPKKGGAFRILHSGTRWVLCRSSGILCIGKVVPLHAFKACGVIKV